MTFGNQNGTPLGNPGAGFNNVVPPEVSGKFNWGAFLLSWIWGLGNKTYIALIALALSFIPFIGGLAGFAFCIWLGIKGNELAWQNKQFPSVEAFHENQKKWAIAGIIVFAVLFLLGITFGFLLGFAGAMKGSY
jgi:hypothetical protein